ncbi:MAG: RDD family protein [Candidatus Thioglobus sp.]|jgi:uncharacterized RDD family membrane protein YckC|nr:RDD family protein [Candidatus Thioglobus sp.]|tara:strand:- start:1612 stop:2019 length:408 start_codon:yes stop_codon:yes gene_type:complete
MESNVSLVRRLGSMSYDLFLVFSLVFFVSGIVIIIISNKQAITSPIFFFLCPLPLTYGYFALSWVKGKQTLGMKAWKFEIVQSNGTHITYSQSLIRFFLASISLVGIGFVFQLFNKHKIPLHDYYSKTYLTSTIK